MNAERLHAIVAALNAELKSSGVISYLDQLVASLQNQVSQPAHPPYEQLTAQAYSQLLEALRRTELNRFNPTYQQVLEELGASAIIGDELALTVESIFGRNTITPTIAHQELSQIQARLHSLQAAIDQLLAAYGTLEIGKEDLPAGDCELAVLVPRAFVDNKLERFGEELEELNRIFGVFAELATGERPGFTIKNISSSDLSVYLELAAVIGACVATAVERIIALYKSLLEIRKLQGELAEKGVEKENLKGLEDHANGIMDKGIEVLIGDLIQEFCQSVDNGRKNELSIELKYSLKKIANRIDRGFNIEVRMQAPPPVPDADSEPQQQGKTIGSLYAKIQTAARTMQFLKLEGPPILSLETNNSRTDEKKA